MGLFDYLQCDYILPNGEFVDGPVWQTKDGPCDIGTVHITAEGAIRFEIAHYEDVPEQEREYWGTPEWDSSVTARLSGCIRRVIDGYSGESFSGSVNFYRSLPLDDREWEEYIAVFLDGKLRGIRTVPRAIAEVEQSQPPRE